MRDTTAPPQPTLSELHLATLMSRVLRGGVLISACIVSIGGLLFLARHGSEHPALNQFSGEPTALRSVGGILKNALAFDGRAIIAAGLLVLVATPFARVALTLVEFVRVRDWRFVGLTAIVLCALLSTLGALL